MGLLKDFSYATEAVRQPNVKTKRYNKILPNVLTTFLVFFSFRRLKGVSNAFLGI